MKSTPRRSFGGTAALVAAIALAGLALLWARSPWRGDGIALFGSQGKIGGFFSFRGHIVFALSNISLGEFRAWTAQTFTADEPDSARLHDALFDTARSQQFYGFGAAAHLENDQALLPGGALGQPGCWMRVVAFPHWLPMGLCLVPIGRWSIRRITRWRRGRNGRCLECGYDLRATPQGPCPECGAVAVEASCGVSG